MAGRIFQIQDGLSQRNREFPELSKGFYSIDSMSTESILDLMKKYARDNGCPHFFDDVDLPKVVSMLEGEADGNTDPAVAIYAVCAKLMGRVQDSLNCLPDKRIDFYYRNVLGESNLPADGDHAIVTFDVDNDDVSCVLPKGTRFSAGENSKGENVEFDSISDANINDVKVSRILTVSCAKGCPITQSEIPVFSPKDACGQKMVPYPLFGLTRSNDMPEGTQFSKVGVCISNRIFYMSSGVRNVKLSFLFTPSSVQGTVVEKKNCNASEFAAAFTNAFTLSMTTNDGWFDVEDYKIGCCNLNSTCAENQVTIEFTLKDCDPAIVNYDPEIHGGDYRSSNPVLRLLVNPRKSESLWEALIKLQIQSVHVAVNVSKCRDIVVSNEYGPASTLLPVQIFGSVPKVGSSFIVGCKETCGKKLNSFDVHGKWSALPNCRDFSEWYAQYDNPPRTSDFEVELSGLYGGAWLPSKKNAVTCKLFSVEKNRFFDYDIAATEIPSDFSISFNSIVSSRISESIPDEEGFMYSPMMKDGFFKMRLTSPSKAFMHEEISRAVCNSFLTQILKKKNVDILPNQPYTPSVEDLYVNYSSYADISMISKDADISDGFFYLHPFGYSRDEAVFIQNGALYLGLSFKGKPKKANLYFVMNRDSAMRSYGRYFWAYLTSSGWKSLPEENRLADSTSNFTSSGIVSLNLPQDMANETHLMPQGLYWIRITPRNESWRECSRLLTVFTQALEVKRVCGFENGSVMEHCKPQTIKELATSIGGLSNVFQIEESFAGRVQESDKKMRVRVAESLYHRNRSLCMEDYERMILEEFPEVHKVKCFPHIKVNESLKHYDFTCAGHLLVVPVSPMFCDGSFQWDPCLNGSVLRNICEFLQKKVSGLSKVRVMNPFFDKLQVRCNVKLRCSENEGEILLDLNEKINRYLSPWFPQPGGITKHFGWTLDRECLKSYIESLDYVESVGDDFTIMKVASTDSQKFMVNLFENTDEKLLHGSFPWSIAVPMRKHFINSVDSCSFAINDDVNNGYGGLEIGQTFIIRRT